MTDEKGRWAPDGCRRVEHSPGLVFYVREYLDAKGVQRFEAIAYRGNRSQRQWYYTFRSNEEREARISKEVEGWKEYEQIKEARKATRKAKRFEIRTTGAIYQGAAEAAKGLKAELKQVWPWVKFSVCSEQFAGGNAIRVSWNLGPTTEEVERYSGKYQQGSFDGMTDSYDYDETKVVDEHGKIRELGGAKYVSLNRSTEGCREAIEEQICTFLQVEYLPGMALPGRPGFPAGERLSTIAWRIISRTSFGPEGFHGIRELMHMSNIGDTDAECFEAY